VGNELERTWNETVGLIRDTIASNYLMVLKKTTIKLRQNSQSSCRHSNLEPPEYELRVLLTLWPPRKRYGKNIINKYSITPLMRINWDGKPFGYAENPDNRIFLCI